MSMHHTSRAGHVARRNSQRTKRPLAELSAQPLRFGRQLSLVPILLHPQNPDAQTSTKEPL